MATRAGAVMVAAAYWELGHGGSGDADGMFC